MGDDMPGPLPATARRRTNAPAIPTTELPAAGNDGRRKPKCPLHLGRAGATWWSWAWRLPHASAWSEGDLYVLARRAQLEDDAAALELPDIDLAHFLGVDRDEQKDALNELEGLLVRLKAIAGHRNATLREQRELDDRLGLTPKGMAALRWRIVDTTEGAAPAAGEVPDDVKKQRERRARLTADAS